MEEKRITTPVGKKTKDIFNALKEAYAQIDEQGENLAAITTDLVKAREAANEAIVSANESNLDAIKALLGQLENAQEKYDKLKLAITEKEAELKKVHGIEVKANTLSALMVAYDNTLKAKEEDAAKIIADATEKAEILITNAKETAKVTLEEVEAKANAQRLKLEEQAINTKREREREIEQYTFDFNIKKRNAEQELNDKLVADGRRLDERAAELTAKTLEYKDKDKQIAQLSNEIISLNTTKEQEIEKRVNEAEAKLSRSHAIEKVWIKKDHDTELSIQIAALENAKANNADLKAHIAKLEASLEKANVKVSEIAQAALVDANKDKSIASFATALATSNSNKK